MRQINQKWDKLLRVLFEYPQEKFTVRELAKRTKIPPSSLQRYLMKLRKLQVINKENTLVLSSYVRYVKMSFFVEQMYISGLVQYLEQELQASTIILFGSIRKGEYDAESDVDIFVASVKKIKLDLSVYEKALGHPIQLFIEENIYKLPERLRNNVLNGIKLQGYFSL